MNAVETFAHLKTARESLVHSVPATIEFDARCQLIHKLDLALAAGKTELARQLATEIANLGNPKPV